MNGRWADSRYSVYRALLGSYLFVHFAHLIAWGPELFSNEGMIRNAANSPIFGIIPSVLSISDSPAMVVVILAIGAVASLFFAAGKYDRIAALVMWYILACLLGRNPLISNPALPYLGWMLLAHLFVSGKRMPREIYIAAWIVLALSYSYSGYTKLLSPSWVSGDTVWYVLQNPLARDDFVRDFFVALGPDVARGIDWIILVVELLFAPLALFRRMRPIVWGIMLAVQFGFLLLLNFADLTTPMLLFHLLTFDPKWIQPAGMRNDTDRVVIFDGVCNLCAHCVRFILRHEADHTLRFTPLQSPAGARLMRDWGFDPEDVKTFVLVADGKAYVRSDAAIRVSRHFDGPWKLLGAIRIIPRPIRDWVYGVVARNRYRWFGRFDACMVPTPEVQARFIQE